MTIQVAGIVVRKFVACFGARQMEAWYAASQEPAAPPTEESAQDFHQTAGYPGLAEAFGL